MEALRLVLWPHECRLLRGRYVFWGMDDVVKQLLSIGLEPKRFIFWKPASQSSNVLVCAGKRWRCVPVEANYVLTRRQALRWLAAFGVVYPFTVCFLVVTKLLVLDRLIEFSKLKAGEAGSRLVLFGRVLLAIVVIGSAIGLVSNIVGAVFFCQAADSFSLIAADNSSGLDTYDERKEKYEVAKAQVAQGTRAVSVHFLFEFFVMILVVGSFVGAGVACIRRIRYALSRSGVTQAVPMSPIRSERAASTHLSAAAAGPDVAARGRELQRQIVVTCSVVFLAFLIRAAHSGMTVVASAAQNLDIDCGQYGDIRCRDCNNAFANMLVWLLYTPHFYFAVALVSQPIALLVALWGMTSGQALKVLRARDTEPLQ